MIKKCMAGVFAFVFFSSVAAQSIDSQKLDSYFASLEKHDKFMGSVAVSRHGKVVYAKSIGFSDAQNKTKADSDSKYGIGSISKTFTAVLVMKAVEEKKLTLDQTIAQFFPTLPNADKITLKQLLGHRSGVYDFTDEDDYRTWNTKPKSETEMVAIIAKGGSEFAPGTKTEYSNSNYALLTYVLEKTYKKTYAELLQQYIAKPLALKNTSFGKPINTANNECRSYSFEDGWNAAPETHASVSLGSGGIVSTATDLLKFSDALFTGKVLKKESLEAMMAIRDGYGLGLLKTPFYEKTGYGHRGNIDKFNAAFSYFPGDDVSFALVSNGSNYNGNEIPVAVLSAVFDKPFETPQFTSHEVGEAELDQYAGVYSSAQLPIKITIGKQDKTLTAQATGQSAMPMEATAKDVFAFPKAGIALKFDVANKQMTLKQNGAEFTFTRD